MPSAFEMMNNGMMGGIGSMGAGVQPASGDYLVPKWLPVNLGQGSQGFLSFSPKQGGFWDRPISCWGEQPNKPQGMLANFLKQISNDLQQCGAIPTTGAPTPVDFSNISAPMDTPGMVGGSAAIEI